MSDAWHWCCIGGLDRWDGWAWLLAQCALDPSLDGCGQGSSCWVYLGSDSSRAAAKAGGAEGRGWWALVRGSQGNTPRRCFVSPCLFAEIARQGQRLRRRRPRQNCAAFCCMAASLCLSWLVSLHVRHCAGGCSRVRALSHLRLWSSVELQPFLRLPASRPGTIFLH